MARAHDGLMTLLMVGRFRILWQLFVHYDIGSVIMMLLSILRWCWYFSFMHSIISIWFISWMHLISWLDDGSCTWCFPSLWYSSILLEDDYISYWSIYAIVRLACRCIWFLWCYQLLLYEQSHKTTSITRLICEIELGGWLGSVRSHDAIAARRWRALYVLCWHVLLMVSLLFLSISISYMVTVMLFSIWCID